jgi:hypothetical protein
MISTLDRPEGIYITDERVEYRALRRLQSFANKTEGFIRLKRKMDFSGD